MDALALRLGAVVLCGGMSRRMGRPKAWLPFGDEVLLQRVVRRLATVADTVVVVAAVGQDLPPLPEAVMVVRDEETGRGPLQGLVAGLAALRGRADAAFLGACDAPFLRPALVRRLAVLLEDHAICVPRAGGYDHPLCAVYRLEVEPVARDLLAADRLRPVYLFDALPTRAVGEAEFADVDPELVSLRNLNTPDDYQAALARLNE